MHARHGHAPPAMPVPANREAVSPRPNAEGPNVLGSCRRRSFDLSMGTQGGQGAVAAREMERPSEAEQPAFAWARSDHGLRAERRVLESRRRPFPAVPP